MRSFIVPTSSVKLTPSGVFCQDLTAAQDTGAAKPIQTRDTKRHLRKARFKQCADIEKKFCSMYGIRWTLGPQSVLDHYCAQISPVEFKQLQINILISF